MVHGGVMSRVGNLSFEGGDLQEKGGVCLGVSFKLVVVCHDAT